MSSYSNTFGTFLRTINNLNSINDVSSRRSGWAENSGPNMREMIDIIRSIAQNDGVKPIKDIGSDLGVSSSDILFALIECKNQGLLETLEIKGEPSAKLTPLGKAFAS